MIVSVVCVLLHVSSTEAVWCKDDFCRWKKCNTPLDACRNLPIQTEETERICQEDYKSCVKECCTKRRRLRRDAEDIQHISFGKPSEMILNTVKDNELNQSKDEIDGKLILKNSNAVLSQRVLFLSIKKCELGCEFSTLKLCPVLYYKVLHLEKCRINVKRVCTQNCSKKFNEASNQ